MNFDTFEKKAKCIFCARPININKTHIKRTRQYKLFACECTLSQRRQYSDGYTFYLPVSNKYQIQIDTRVPEFKVELIEPSYITNLGGITSNIVIDTIVCIDELPDFILLPRLKLIDKLEEYLAFI